MRAHPLAGGPHPGVEEPTIRILLLTQHFPPEQGAHASRWAWLSSAVVERGHSLDVVVPRWRNAPRLEVDHPGMTVHEVRAVVPGLGLKRRLLNEAITMSQSVVAAVRAPQPDVVLTTVPALSTLPLGWFVSKARRIPMVLELRDAWPHLLDEIETWNDDGTTVAASNQNSHRRVAGLIASLVWRLEASATATVVTAEALREDLTSRGQRDVVTARNVSHRRISLPPVSPNGTGLHVLYLGSFGRAQKLSTAVRAARIAQDMGVDITLRLVGDGVHDKPLRGLVERLQAPVEILPRVGGEQVAALYEWADTVLVMLRDWQGMDLTVPSKLYEVMECGRHVSGSLMGEAGEIVTQAGCGDVVPPEDAEALAKLWADLAHDRSRLEVSGRGAAWLAEHGTPEAQAHALLRALERASAPAKPTPWRRAVAAVRDVGLTTRTVAAHLDEDSATFYVQLARRTGLGRRLSQRGPDAWRVLAAHLADRTAELDTAATAWAANPTGRAVLDRLAASALLARGRDHLVPEPLISDADRARRRLEAGDLSGALELAPTEARLAVRTASLLRVLDPDFRVELPPLRRRSAREPGRVLHVLTNYLPQTRSGYTLRSNAIMRAQADLGWQVEVATRIGYPVTVGHLGNPEVQYVDGIAVHRLIPWVMPAEEDERLAEYARLLDRVAERRRPSILHTTTEYTNALAVAAVAQRRGIPWVYEMRGQLELTWLSKRPEHLQAQAEDSQRLRLQRGRETACALAADAVVVLSQVQRDDLIARGVPAERITIVPNAVDQSLLKRTTTPRQARQQLGVDEGDHWVGAVSSLVGYEGFDVLLRAVALLRQQGHDVHCALVGEGTSRPGLAQLARELGIEDACVLPGRVPKADALTWVEALDVAVVPRLDTPVCRMITPLKPIEAMALGRPVVGSDLPALRELLEPTGGRLVPPEDPEALAAGILATLENPDSLRRQVEAGREWAARRTWQEAARRYDQLYTSLGGHT